MQERKMWAILLHLGCNMWLKMNPYSSLERDEELSNYRDYLYTD